MRTYSAFGLTIASEIVLPELALGAGVPDVTIRLGKVECADGPGNGPQHVSPEEFTFRYESAGVFAARGGREIVADVADDAIESVVRLCLLGPIVAGILHQRGVLVLHASAVAIEGHAVAFLGGRGYGKSTMAAFLGGEGHPLLSDDVLALDLDARDGVKVVPGFPNVKLWPDSAEWLGVAGDQLQFLQPQLPKRGHRLDAGFGLERVPLACIYVLDVGDEVAIEELGAGAGMAELVKHSYMGQHIKATDTATRHFRQCSSLLAAVPMRVLRRPPSLAMLPHIGALVRHDVMTVRGSSASLGSTAATRST